MISIDQWQVGSVRATIFYGRDSAFDSRTWWREVIGEQPDQIEEQPKTASIVQIGSMNDVRIRLVVKPGRIDWILFDDKPDRSDELVPNIGRYYETVNIITNIVQKWCEVPDFPIATRIAFAPDVLYPVEDRINGYEILVPFLHSVTLDKQNMSDFLYRINRRRPSKLNEELEINRLSTWSVVRWLFDEFSYTMGHKEVDSSTIIERFTSRIQLDVNTVQEFNGLFHSDNVPEHFAELVELGTEIASEGDIR